MSIVAQTRIHNLFDNVDPTFDPRDPAKRTRRTDMHVDKLGDYRTRDGRRVRVHTIKTNRTFSVQGAIYQMFRGKERTRGFHIWQPNGRFMALQEHKLDLVEFIG